MDNQENKTDHQRNQSELLPGINNLEDCIFLPLDALCEGCNARNDGRKEKKQSTTKWKESISMAMSVPQEDLKDQENCLEQKQKLPRRRCQQPKVLNSPEDNIYYNQLNGTLGYQGSKRKPRKLGQIKVLDWEDEYYKSLSVVDSITEEDNTFQPLTPFQS